MMEFDFLANQILIYPGDRYKPIYDFFREKYDISISELFLLCMAVGRSKSRKGEREGTILQFRSNYLTTHQRKYVYAVLLSEDEETKVETFLEKERHTKFIREIIEKYAVGGMEILIEEIFQDNWDGNTLEYRDNYLYSLEKYVSSIAEEIPF